MVRDANATGHSVPSGNLCDITAPNPYDEASLAN